MGFKISWNVEPVINSPFLPTNLDQSIILLITYLSCKVKNMLKF